MSLATHEDADAQPAKSAGIPALPRTLALQRHLARASRVRLIYGRYGWGLYAAAAIPADTTLHVDVPIACTTLVPGGLGEHVSHYMYSDAFDELYDAGPTTTHALPGRASKFATNAFGGIWSVSPRAYPGASFSIGDPALDVTVTQVVFFYISRVNHACTPNALVAIYVTPAGALEGFLRTRVDIAPRTEITISYLSDAIYTKAQRAARLAHYGIVCACPICA